MHLRRDRAPRARNGLDGVTLVPCEWGPEVGSPVDMSRVTASLPPGDEPVELDDVSDTPAAWGLLIDDPRFELRIAGEGQPEGAPVPSVGLRPEQQARANLLALAAAIPEDVLGALAVGELAPAEFAAAANQIAESDELERAAVKARRAYDPDLADAIARAVVAAMLSPHRSDEPGTTPAAALDREVRAGLVSAILAAYAPEGVMGVGGWLRTRLKRFALRPVTSLIDARRDQVMGGASPPIADILYYQQRGEDIRRFVADVVARAQPPVVVVGHSLGGVILVDLLAAEPHPHVDLLVTVGSQAPMFFAIDALATLRLAPNARPFTPWLNVYSRDDFLSFCAQPVFPDVPGIVDVPIDAGVPFPESHSAYWRHDAVYETIRDHWPSMQ